MWRSQYITISNGEARCAAKVHEAVSDVFFCGGVRVSFAEAHVKAPGYLGKASGLLINSPSQLAAFSMPLLGHIKRNEVEMISKPRSALNFLRRN